MTSPLKTLDIVALGEAMVEFNQTSNLPPDEAPLYLQGFGGDTSNAAIAGARAGARVAYLSRLGTDRWGDRLMDLWQRESVSTRSVLRDGQAPTGMYFVSHDAQGHHFSYARAGSAASRMQAQDLTQHWAEAVASSHWLHLSGISLAISASACDTAFATMQYARSTGTRVALDSNLRLSLWPLARAQACIRHAVSLCDLFLPSLEDMTALTGLTQAQDIIGWSHAQGAAQVVLKLGAEGALASDGQSLRQVPGHMVKAIDATGAGDCFAGNLLARLAAGDDLWGATAYANAAASLSVQGFGAVAPLPYLDAVMNVLKPTAKVTPA
ncbi:2-dehydro-3-deoxygluconokinase [Limnohabitans sp. 2KL-17]|uniref:sugar kinase n=1 Tax=Limnohabitans sp. 2KL-17 TaxID=1100704 RepID=UPI000D3DA26F|nr:sugar kinase [Limnohabitans sp. 2KL-17]PUE56345.1 2-dehydro-3-deoxygluconokinase [Limnohabitans sp. 2KL-17]